MQMVANNHSRDIKIQPRWYDVTATSWVPQISSDIAKHLGSDGISNTEDRNFDQKADILVWRRTLGSSESSHIQYESAQCLSSSAPMQGAPFHSFKHLKSCALGALDDRLWADSYTGEIFPSYSYYRTNTENIIRFIKCECLLIPAYHDNILLIRECFKFDHWSLFGRNDWRSSNCSYASFKEYSFMTDLLQLFTFRRVWLYIAYLSIAWSLDKFDRTELPSTFSTSSLSFSHIDSWLPWFNLMTTLINR